MFQNLTPEQIAQARKIDTKKGRFYTDKSFKQAVDQEIARVQNALADKLLGYYTVASVFAITDTLEPTYEQLVKILQKTEETYLAMNDPNCEMDFKQLRQEICDETGIWVTLDKE